MKIIECCPFFNENTIAEVHWKESKKWVDEFHITESNRTFRYGAKDYNFNPELQADDKLYYHKLNGEKLFKPLKNIIPTIEIPKISRSINKFYYRDSSWRNEACQRNYSLWNCDYSDNDILILSDIDEIIDSRYSDEIIDYVKKRGIVTVKIHFTNFYFNLFCLGFGGPPDYSYRIFIVRGDIMRTRFKNDSDYLRKLGEAGILEKEVFCFPEFRGFHHSWLGDWKNAYEKINSYAHSTSDHCQALLSNGHYDLEKIKKFMELGHSIFPNTELKKNESIQLLDAVEELRDYRKDLFI